MRYLLIDRIDSMKLGEWARGSKCVTRTEDCFEHHFPGQPIYPGALLTESMAQLGGALLELSLRTPGQPTPRCVLSSVKAKFRGFVRPGDRLALHARVDRLKERSARVRVEGWRDEERVCQADLLYVFLVVDDPRLEASRQDFLDQITRYTEIVE